MSAIVPFSGRIAIPGTPFRVTIPEVQEDEMSALLGAVGIRRGIRHAAPGAPRRHGMLVRRRHRRRRGISAAELRGFKKVATLLASFGMRPRGLAHPMHRRRSRFSVRRRGDPEDSE